MLQFIVRTLAAAFPVLLPIVVLMIARWKRFSYPPQRLLFAASFVFYALALFAFLGHGWQTSGGIGEFFRAFYGMPVEKTALCLLGFAMQGMSAVMMLFVVNWSTIELYKMRKARMAEIKAQEEQRAEEAAGKKSEAKAVKKTTEDAV